MAMERVVKRIVAGFASLRQARDHAWAILFVAATAGMLTALYASALPLPFVSDDYDFLASAGRGLGEALRFKAQFYHYIPTTKLAFYVIYLIFGRSPMAYHVVGLLAHIVNTCLVGLLAWKLTRRPVVVAAAGLLFATSSLTYEVPLWATGLFMSLSTLLYLLALLLYMAWRARPMARRYVAFAAGFALALLAHEQGVTLLLVCALYELLMVENGGQGKLDRRRIAGWLRGWALPAILLIAYVAIKVAFSDRNLMTNAASLKETFWAFRVNMWRVLLPNADQALAIGMDDMGRAHVALRLLWWALVAGALALMVWRSPARRFLLAWTLVQVGVITYAAVMESRHFYLPLAPAVVLLVSAAHDALRALPAAGRAAHWREVIAAGLLLAGVLGVAGVGSAGLLQRKAIWTEAAGLAQRVLQATLAAYAQCQDCPNVYLLNFPDGLPISPVETAYVFRNGIRNALYLNGVSESVVIARVHTADATWTWDVRRGSTAARVTPAQVAALSRRPGVLVIDYRPELGNVEAVGR